MTRPSAQLTKNEQAVLGALYKMPGFTGSVRHISDATGMSERIVSEVCDALASTDRCLGFGMLTAALEGSSTAAHLPGVWDNYYSVKQAWIDRLDNPPRPQSAA